MFQTISMEQLESYLNQGRQQSDFMLMDVRDRPSFERGHLEGAVNVPFEELDQFLNKIPRDKPVVIYCAHGSQSMMAARVLSRLGYDVVNTVGGLFYYRGSHLVT